MKKTLVSGVLFTFAGLSFACPTKEQAISLLKKTASVPVVFKILNISQLPHLNLCQVVLKVHIKNQPNLNQPPQAVYLSDDGRYFIYGNIVDLKNGANLTTEALARYNKVSSAIMKELKKHIAFSYYQGKSYFGNNPPPAKHYIYFITDPKCPFCHASEPKVKAWADKHNVEIRVVYDPLPIHPGSYQIAVGLYCHKKGWNSLYNAYTKSSPLPQCKQGEKFIKESMKLASEAGATGTPTFINQYREVFVGEPPNEQYMNSWLHK